MRCCPPKSCEGEGEAGDFFEVHQLRRLSLRLLISELQRKGDAVEEEMNVFWGREVLRRDFSSWAAS